MKKEDLNCVVSEVSFSKTGGNFVTVYNLTLDLAIADSMIERAKLADGRTWVKGKGIEEQEQQNG